MAPKYKSACYQIDPSRGVNDSVVASLDVWLNAWLSKGYIVDKMTEITRNGDCCGFMFIFRTER